MDNNKMEIFKSVWLENIWETSEDMIENFVEIEISCITYTADHGDQNIEIAAEKGEVEKVCSALKSYKIIDETQAEFMIENEVDIIVLY
jgi:hypothetical protein